MTYDAPQALALFRGLMGLGHGLGLTVTAEGVELPAQAADLAQDSVERMLIA